MTKQEFVKVVDLISALYPTFKLENNNKTQMSVWYEMLCDLEIQFALLAIKKMAMTEHFAPSIAKIRENYSNVTNPKRVDDNEGWGLVMKAVRNYGYMRADEAMESLPQEVRTAVEHMGGFEMICESEEPDVLRGQFFRAMQGVNSRNKENNQLSLEMQQVMEQLAEKMSIKAVEKTKMICGTKSCTSESNLGLEKVRAALNYNG